MKKFVLAAVAATGMLTLGAATASALPAPGAMNSGTTETMVEKARRDCVWVNNKWTYQRGDKRLVCRPDRPRGSGWTWYREGNRYGWYQPRQKRWNHQNW